MKLTAFFLNKQTIYFFSHQSRKKHFFKVQQSPQVKQKAILPSQYPKDLTDTQPAIRRGRPIRYITPKHQIPQDKFVQNAQLVNAEKYNGKWKSPENAYALNVGLIGPVNSGKSELMGRIVGRKLSAVSPKANTTTDTIEAYKSYEIESQESGLKNIQLKFYDTAGMMYKKTGFISKGWKVLSEIDFSLLVIDSTKSFDQMTKQSIKRLQMHRNYENFMKALVLNKIDLVENRRKFHSLIGQIQKYGKFDKIFYVSATTGYGVDELQQYLLNHAKQRQWQQPKQALTTLTQVEIYEEMMKQCLYHRSYKQVPYQCGIECISIALKSTAIEQIRFKFMVESENQQRMILGKEGNNVKWILDRFKVYYAETYKKPCEVYIDVRIQKKNNQQSFLKEQTTFDEETQKRMYEQKIAVVEEHLHAQGKFKKENMIPWTSFLNKTNKSDLLKLATQEAKKLPKSQGEVKEKPKPKRRLKKYPNTLKRQ